jgi:hypothetical protein
MQHARHAPSLAVQVRRCSSLALVCPTRRDQKKEKEKLKRKNEPISTNRRIAYHHQQNLETHA